MPHTCFITTDSTGHTVKVRRSRDAHNWPTRNVSE